MSSGNKPVFGPNGEVLGPITRNILSDPGYQPTLRENLALGVGKAHRSVVYSNYDYRSFKRSYLNETGKVE